MNTNLNILVIDDDPQFAEAVRGALTRAGSSVTVALSGGEGGSLFSTGEFDIVIVDKGLPDYDGIKLAAALKGQKPNTMIIVVTGLGNEDDAMAAVKAGCDDYLFKPFSNESLLFSVRRLVEFQSLRLERKLTIEKGRQSADILFISGKSRRMEDALEKIARVRDLDATVVIQGETGTGKELVAKAIHYSGNRSNNPFVEVNCSALPEQLFESELFGHVKGAYTNATNDNKGFFIAADGGTLFLDEIADMPISVQPKLLKVIEEKRVTRLGATAPKVIDTRIIAATSKPLEREVASGRLRSELFYRLNTVVINLPPLRERVEDIPDLVAYFARQSSKKWGNPNVMFANEALRQMKSYSWPGNVRELRNVVERSIIMSNSDLIERVELGMASLEGSLDLSRPFQEVKKEVIAGFEIRYFSTLLKETKGNLTEASNRAGMNIKNLSEKLKLYGISLKEFKA
ncbi:MAG: sigma-54 dependent transcriptional regulator [Bacteroidetes bacterium]|nr:sigma-54 dependent transcriptional regulator [Bacteroidota bacterium]